MSVVFNPFTGNFDEVSDLTVNAVGSSPNANGITATQSGTALSITLQPADTTHPGVVPNIGGALGVAPLDASSKIPLAYLPSTVFLFQGNWNPNTNTPTLVDGTGVNGYVYYVTAARTGAVSGLNNASMVNFQIGDLVIYNGTQYELTSPAAGVQSVNGAQGAVTVNAINQLTGDATAGPASGSASAALTLATVNSNVGTFASVTVNAKGLVTAATNLSGDITSSGATTTLATVNTNVGSFGSASSVPTFTVNAKGLTTAAGSTSIQIAESQVTNLVSDLAGKQPTGNYITALTGDVTASGPGSSAATLATVNTNVGSFGSSSTTPTFTVNGKGLITAAASNSIQIAESQVTNLVSDLAGKQPTGNYITALTGDATASGAGSAAITLATVNSNVGSFGNATAAATFTVNGKGLITAAGATTITPALTSVTGGTAGSIIFSNGTNLTQDNAKLFWDDTNFRLGINTASPQFPLDVQFASNSQAIQITNTNSSQSTSGGAILALSANSGAAMTTGNRLGFLNFQGFDGTNQIKGAGIQAFAQGTWSGSSSPASMVLYTSGSGSHNSLTAALTLDTNQGATFAGPITVSNLGTGVVHSGAAGLFTSSAVSLTADVSGTLPVANGGTGVTASSGASSLMLRDSNQNTVVNNIVKNFTTTATAAGTTTLTVSSSPLQQFTGTTTQTVKLPDATTLTTGFQFNIFNRSTGIVTVRDNTNTVIQSMAAGTQLNVTCSSNGSTAGSWDVDYTFTGVLPISQGGTGSSTVSTSPTSTTWAGWDANSNMNAAGFIPKLSSLATSGITVSLLASSNQDQVYTGSSTETVKLPVASTLSNGQYFNIYNLSTGVVTVQTSGLNTLQAMATNTVLTATCVNNGGGTGTASWAWTYNPLGSSLPVTTVAPTVQTFTSGSGTYTTPTSPRSPLVLRIRAIGGGGGGAGSATNNSGGTGGTGTATSFGSSILVCNGGTGGTNLNPESGGTGGSASVTTSATVAQILAIAGAPGNCGGLGSVANVYTAGGNGASSPFGGGCQGGASANAPPASAGAYGTGGGGAGSPSAGTAGAGGASGGYCEVFISSPAATYSYVIGTGGAGGTAGTGGTAGGAGISGAIIVEEFYQ